jgi:hypothetical protein
MTVSPLVWTLTIVLIGGLLLFDFFFHVRKAHTPTRHLAENYLDLGYEEDQAVRAAGYQRLADEDRRVKALPEKYRRYIREEQKLLDLIAKAHAVHDERVRDAG